MTWGWSHLPVDSNATGTTGGGKKGSVSDAREKATWPRYEAEYLKRALQSDRYKYDTEGLTDEAKHTYLDRVTAHFKEEAEECLKAEFDQWLQGLHEANDPEADHEYTNSDGKPVRRWVMRSKEAEDENGGSKVGQARAGWKHTPWGRAQLTGLPGVRDYLRNQKETANRNDLKMQLLAEFGPQNLEEAWMYFKHWVKGRPLSDAVALPARFTEPAPGARSDVGHMMPQRMYAYDSERADGQPEVLASDKNAYNAAVALPGQPPVQSTTDAEDANVRDARHLREQMESVLQKSDYETEGMQEAQLAEYEIEEREKRAEEADVANAQIELDLREAERQEQTWRRQSLTAPSRELQPALA